MINTSKLRKLIKQGKPVNKDEVAKAIRAKGDKIVSEVIESLVKTFGEERREIITKGMKNEN
jgi:predicted DNA-binding protein (UPF0278 family)